MSDLGNRNIMAENIEYYMRKNNVSRKEICEALNLKYSTFSDWVNAKKYPRIDKIEMLANYFGIEKSDLVENRKQSVDPDQFDFSTPQEALSFILKQEMIADYGGYDLDTMSDDEIMEMAEDVADMLKIVSRKHKK